jgi:hypothetical protein
MDDRGAGQTGLVSGASVDPAPQPPSGSARFRDADRGRPPAQRRVDRPSRAAQLIVRSSATPRRAVEWGYLDWSSVDDSLSAFSRREILFWDRTEQALVGSTASGNGRFEGNSIAYELLDDPDAASATYTVHAGRNEIVLRAKRRCGVDLRLDRAAAEVLRGAVRLEWTCLATGATNGFVWDTRFAGLTKDFSHALSNSPDPSTAAVLRQQLAQNCFALPGPGRYRFSFPEFRTIAPFEVDVKEGEFVKYEVRGR